MVIKHIHVLTVVLVCTENKLLIIFYVNHHCDIFVSSVDVYSNNSIIGLCLVFYVNVFSFCEVHLLLFLSCHFYNFYKGQTLNDWTIKYVFF